MVKLYIYHAELCTQPSFTVITHNLHLETNQVSLKESLHAIPTCFVVVESNVRLQLIKMKTLSSLLYSACIANLRCRADIFYKRYRNS
jgi:hypothetical protein